MPPLAICVLIHMYVLRGWAFNQMFNNSEIASPEQVQACFGSSAFPSKEQQHWQHPPRPGCARLGLRNDLKPSSPHGPFKLKAFQGTPTFWLTRPSLELSFQLEKFKHVRMYLFGSFDCLFLCLFVRLSVCACLLARSLACLLSARAPANVRSQKIWREAEVPLLKSRSLFRRLRSLLAAPRKQSFELPCDSADGVLERYGRSVLFSEGPGSPKLNARAAWTPKCNLGSVRIQQLFQLPTPRLRRVHGTKCHGKSLQIATVDGRNPFRTTVQKPWKDSIPP